MPRNTRRKSPVPNRRVPLDESTRLLIDPVCTMKVDDESTEFTTEYDGITYFFCSNACKEEFETDPERYVAAV